MEVRKLNPFKFFYFFKFQKVTKYALFYSYSSVIFLKISREFLLLQQLESIRAEYIGLGH